MTKKDYEKIAAAFAKQGTATPDDADDYTKGLYLGRRDAIYTLSEVLRKDNPRFDQEHFLAACGL